MEAKDTQTGDGNVCKKHHILKGIYCWDCVYQAGIKEVVDWIEKESKFGIPKGLTKQSQLDWQTKLKAWR